MLSKRKKKGFTFVEILLVGAILAVLGLTLYTTLSNGINFWLRMSQEQPAEEIILFFERFSRDLRNSFRYAGIDFMGNSDEISFPTIGQFQWKDVKKEGIGRISYFFDRTTDTLKTTQSNYSQAYQNKVSYERELVKGIESLSFKYYSYDSAEKVFFWASSWQYGGDGNFGVVAEKSIPLAVKVELEIQDGRLNRKFQKTVFIPAAYHSSFAKQ
ncbi:type II secretion system protein J [Candidatus Omnitrophota bacterium]